MPDMLVKLHELPDVWPLIESLKESGILIKRAIAPEKHIVVDWVEKHFSKGWASECGAAFASPPVPCYLAIEGEKIAGFAVYETTYKDYFGPTGVLEEYRKRGIGKALLLACLHDMRAIGYAYAIIGAAGPADYYAKCVNAVPVENWDRGIYKNMLKKMQE